MAMDYHVQELLKKKRIKNQKGINRITIDWFVATILKYLHSSSTNSNILKVENKEI